MLLLSCLFQPAQYLFEFFLGQVPVCLLRCPYCKPIAGFRISRIRCFLICSNRFFCISFLHGVRSLTIQCKCTATLLAQF